MIVSIDAQMCLLQTEHDILNEASAILFQHSRDYSEDCIHRKAKLWDDTLQKAARLSELAPVAGTRLEAPIQAVISDMHALYATTDEQLSRLQEDVEQTSARGREALLRATTVQTHLKTLQEAREALFTTRAQFENPSQS